jgi:putative NADH-flavin reductase
MRLILFGPTGMIGSRILKEALSRGHQVTAIARDSARVSVAHEKLAIVSGNVLNPANVAEVIKGHDAVISAIGPTQNATAVVVEAARSLIGGLARAGLRRLVVVGGAGILEVAPGVQLVDTPNFPEAYRDIAIAHRDAYSLYQAADLDWTFVSPAAEIAPGERTGKFRVGANTLITDADGQSRIAAEDYAIALLNEVEHPQFIHQCMTVAY